MYLVELDISGLLQLSKKDDETFLTKYVGLLKKNILSKPSERQLPSELRKEMYSIFTSVNKGNYNNTMKKFTKAVKENKQAIVKNRIKENLQTLQEEKQYYYYYYYYIDDRSVYQRFHMNQMMYIKDL